MKIYFNKMYYMNGQKATRYYLSFPEYGREIAHSWDGTLPKELHKDLQALVDDPNKILLLDARRHEIGWVEKGTYELGVQPLNRPLTDDFWNMVDIKPYLNIPPTRLLRILKSIDSNNKWYYEVGHRLNNIMLFNHGFHDIIAIQIVRVLFEHNYDSSPIYEQIVMNSEKLKNVYDKLNKPYDNIPKLSYAMKSIEKFVINPNETNLESLSSNTLYELKNDLHYLTWNQLKMILDKYPTFINFEKFVAHDNLYINELIEQYGNKLSVNHNLIKTIIKKNNFASKSLLKFINGLDYTHIDYNAYKLMKNNNLLSDENYNEYYHHAPTETIAKTAIVLKNSDLTVDNLNTRLAEIWLAWYEQSDDHRNTINIMFEEIIAKFGLKIVINKLIEHKLLHLAKYNIAINDYLLKDGLIKQHCYI